MPIRVPRPIFDNRISPFVRAMERAPQDIIQRRDSLSDVPILLAKTTGIHAQDATQDVELWFGEKGAETNSGETVEAFNRFTELGSGAWCFVRWIDNGFEILPRGGGGEWECQCIGGIGDAQIEFGKYIFDGHTMEFDGGGVWSSDAFELDCDTPIDVYYKMTSTGTDHDEVVVEMLKDSDDSLVARWINQLTYWRSNRWLMMFRDFVHADYADCEAIPNGCPDCLKPSIATGCACGGAAFYASLTISIGGPGSCGSCPGGGSYALPFFRTSSPTCCQWAEAGTFMPPGSACAMSCAFVANASRINVWCGFTGSNVNAVNVNVCSSTLLCGSSASKVISGQTLCQLAGTPIVMDSFTPGSGCAIGSATVTFNSA